MLIIRAQLAKQSLLLNQCVVGGCAVDFQSYRSQCPMYTMHFCHIFIYVFNEFSIHINSSSKLYHFYICNQTFYIFFYYEKFLDSPWDGTRNTISAVLLNYLYISTLHKITTEGCYLSEGGISNL